MITYMDSIFLPILSCITQQHHSFSNAIVRSIVSFNQRFLNLLNDLKALSSDTLCDYQNINPMSRIIVLIDEYPKPRFKSISQQQLNQT